MRLLLLSTSTVFGTGYLDHAAVEIAELFSGLDRILFVPFALRDQEGYARRASERLAALGLAVDRLADDDAGAEAARKIASASGLFVGGGNTFRLLDRLRRCGAIDPIRRRVREGAPYLGASAGTVIAAPTIGTTNDMPIVWPSSLESLGLLPFQINCHYVDPDPSSTHMGETREQRLAEYLEENDRVVVGLREGAMLRVDDAASRRVVVLKGRPGARLFRRGREPEELVEGSALDHLLA